MPAVNYFLQVQGIEGESTNTQFPGSIPVESFSWGAMQSGTVGGSGGGTGKATVSDISVVKRVDKASPPLFLSCVTGRHIASAALVAQRTNPNGVFLEYRLTDVLISSFKDVGTAGEFPLEELTIAFGKIEFTYVPLLASGQSGPPIRVAFDRRTQTGT